MAERRPHGHAQRPAVVTALGAGLACRAAAGADLDPVAQVWLDSARAMDGAPAELPTVDQLRTRIGAELASGWSLTVAVQDGRIVGFLAIKPADAVLDQLFVAPAGQGQGIGRALLECARRAMPGGFTLRTAAANAGARAFYERCGLALIAEGRHPQHGHPVCFYGWTAS